MARYFFSFGLLMAIFCSCQSKPQKPQEANKEQITVSVAQQKATLSAKGFELFEYVDEATGDTIIMQKYFIAFLKKGPNRDQPKAVADSLQALHMAHLGRMYELGYADISGPFDDDSDISGITVYNVPNFKMADSLANMDPMVATGRLLIEIHPWWAAKGFALR